MITSRITSKWIVLLLVGAALILRVYGLNWDGGHLFHPDERHILMVSHDLSLPQSLTLASLTDVNSPLNPKSFVYGSFVFYLVAAITHLLALVTTFTQQVTGALRPDFDGLSHVGRILSAIFDTGTVVVTYVLAAKAYSRRVGILAAAFVALSVLNIQLSHFYASDTLLTFFIVVSILCALSVLRRPTPGNSLALGLFVGLALSSKISAMPILLTVLAAHGLHLFFVPTADELKRQEPMAGASAEEMKTIGDGGQLERDWQLRMPAHREVVSSMLLLLATLLALAAVFVITQPYVVIDFEAFKRDILAQSEMARGLADLPYTRQYVNRAPYLYFIANVAIWGMGLPLGILAFGGWALALARIPFSPRRVDLLLMSWMVPYFAITGSFHAKFLRYMLPLLPFLCVLAALAAVFVIERAGRWTFLARLAVGLVLASTGFYALSYVNLYSAPHTAVEASQWIYENVPPNSSIATEHWEEGMPVPLILGNTSFSPGSQGYKMRTLNLYDPDGEAKVDHIAQVLSSSDYIVFFSNRLYGTIPRLPDRYPVTSEYYHLLFSGQLGFQLESFFTSYPNLLGVSFVDDTFADPGLPAPGALATFRPSPLSLNLGRADESFTVYDHPKVLVFKKHSQIPVADLRQELMDALKAGGVAAGAQLMLTPEQQAKMVEGGTFSTLFNRSDLANRFPILIWVLAVELLGLAALPIAYVLLPGLRDRGYLLGKTLGILLLAWLSWISVSWGLMENDRTTVLAAAVVVVVLGLVVFAFKFREILPFVRRHLPLLIGGELVFWLAFVTFMFIRMANPDLWHPYRGGEKPMDLAYLMATLKSTSFPPYDPWFAGGYMNYYYFGYVIVASLIKLTGILPTTAFNLAVPLLFAMTVAGAFSVGHSLAHRLLSGTKSRAPALSGILAALLTAVLGNLDGAIKIIDQLTRLGGAASVEKLTLPLRIVFAPQGFWQVLTGAQRFDIPSDWFWSSTRVIANTINEFPFFTFLYADLHAHMIALPLTLLALGVALCLLDLSPHPNHLSREEGELAGLGNPLATSEMEGPGVGERPFSRLTRPTSLQQRERFVAYIRALVGSAPTLLLAGLVLGGLFVTNSWDFPTYAIIVTSALVLPIFVRRPSFFGIAVALTRIAIVVVLAYVLYLPFHQSFRSFYTGVEPFPDKTPLDNYVIVHGLFLLILVPFLAWKALARQNKSRTLRGQPVEGGPSGEGSSSIGISVPREQRSVASALGELYELALVIAFAVTLAWMGLHLIAALFALLVALLVALVKRQTVHERFLLVLLGAGVALSVGVEFFAIKGDVGRMNTVFKFYLQVWVLWSIASAVALPLMLRRLGSSPLRALRLVAIAVLALFTLAATVYPVVATKARLEDRFDRNVPLTLDGTAYMKGAEYHDQNQTIPLASDFQAIRWIQDNIEGSPVILEAQTPIYRWGSRISIYTGLPTVLGWDWHQKQQRGIYQAQVDQRATDVKTMYTDPSLEKRVALLKEYRVKYIYVGELERAYYSQASLDRFEDMVGDFLDVVYDHDRVRIYRVKG